MSKITKKIIGVVVLVFALVVGFRILPTKAADFSKKPLMLVFASTQKITGDDVASITALAATPAGDMVDKITITVNNQKESCASTYYCRTTFGPLAVTKSTWIKYTVQAIKKGAGNEESGTTKVGYILVNPKTRDVNKPEFTKIVTSKHQLVVGETFDLKIFTKDKKGVAKIDILLDGQLMYSCEGKTECGTTFGPFSETQIGEHKYEFVVTNLDGKSIKPWGKFWIKTAPAAKPISDNETETSVSISSSLPSLTENDTVTFEAKTEPGDKVLDRLEILVIARVVKTCYTNTCSYTGGPYPERAGNAVSYAATAYFKDGTYKTTGYKNLPVAPTTDDTVSDVTEGSNLLIIAPYKTSVTNNEKIDFKIDVKTVSKPEKINVYVADKLVFTCGSLMTCYYPGGPYLSPNNYYPYKPNYYAEAIYANGDKVLSVKKILTISSGDEKVGYQTDGVKPEVNMTVELKYVGAQGSYAGGYSIKMTANATDNSGSIVKINLYYSKASNPTESPVDTCPKSASPYTCTAQHGTLDYGTKYQYYAEAFDAAGNRAVSEIKYLNVPTK